MYSPVNNKTSVAAVADWVGKFNIQTTPDGLTMIPPASDQAKFDGLVFPPHLADWLKDIRLLRHIPLCYLVPDSALLPPEAIRFFHVDYTWIDRVIDGVFSAANTGTVDATFTYVFLQKVREELDNYLEELATVPEDDGKPLPTGWKYGVNPMTGMLIRSELVKRWPDMIVVAYADESATAKRIGVLRAEPISKDIYIALFAGQPKKVEIREPNIGIRFGVEGDAPHYKVDKRDDKGVKIGGQFDILINDKRCLNLTDLKTKMSSARMAALNLQQPPYIQNFLTSVDESKGSVAPAITHLFLKLKSGKQIKIDKLMAKFIDMI